MARPKVVTQLLTSHLWPWLTRHFPERHVYIRSNGRLWFFTFPSRLQVMLAGLSLIFLGWVAFASVNVIFKDRMIAERDYRYQLTQSIYETRLANLQVSYDELSRLLVVVENRFKSASDEARIKQQTVWNLLRRKQKTDLILQDLADGYVGNPPERNLATAAGSNESISLPSERADVSDSDTASGPIELHRFAPPQSGALQLLNGVLQYLHQAAGRLLERFFGSSDRPPPPDTSAALIRQYPALRILVAETRRVRRIDNGEAALLAQAETQVVAGIAEIRTVIARTGINPEPFVQRVSGAEGGPEISLRAAHLDGIEDANFTTAYLRAVATLGQLDQFLSAMRHIPLTTPVSGPQFARTSGFGPRLDPFTGRLGFHPGIDFAGPLGSIVRATAPGRIDWAGPQGGYGNMVEIDHGFGLRSRYAHLESVLVKVGDTVANGAPIGLLGSTGRSTGPHVHYEVWFDNVVRDPKNFIDAVPGQKAAADLKKRNIPAQ